MVATLCSSNPTFGQNKIDVSVKHPGNQAELKTKDQLSRLLAAFDVSPYVFTKSVVIDADAPSARSYPVLTLNTRYLKDDELLLSTFIHEQYHWYVIQKGKDAEEAMKDLRALFPQIPVGVPEGSNDERSNYIHLLVCYFERRAALALFGQLKAYQIMNFLASDHYTWIYKTVMARPRDIGAIIVQHKIMPPGF
jgi:hypothetical protein